MGFEHMGAGRTADRAFVRTWYPQGLAASRAPNLNFLRRWFIGLRKNDILVFLIRNVGELRLGFNSELMAAIRAAHGA